MVGSIDKDEVSAFSVPLERIEGALAGPWRAPRQMLATQAFGDHATIHDDATAQKLGFKRGTIEGPTHFSQFGPLGYALWGREWFETGCLSAHYRAPCFEGDRVRAFIAEPKAGSQLTQIWMQKEDGTEVLRGTASVGADSGPTALETRLAGLSPLEEPVVLNAVTIGTRTQREPVRMDAGQNMGMLYPFSLADKLALITEPSPWFVGPGSPYGRAIIPVEMISVLLYYTTRDGQFHDVSPIVGLFADQEIRLFRGPLFVGEPYEIDREVVGISGSRRTESLWILTRVYSPGSDEVLAQMLLNTAVLKDSWDGYAARRARLYGSR